MRTCTAMAPSFATKLVFRDRSTRTQLAPGTIPVSATRFSSLSPSVTEGDTIGGLGRFRDRRELFLRKWRALGERKAVKRNAQGAIMN